jgi:hypothetical protein
MISVDRIERWAGRGQFEALLEGVIQNGRPLPLALRLRLSAPESLEVASLALGLQRVMELSYCPHPGALGLARRLCGRLAGMAEVAAEQRPMAGALVAAVGGLLALREQLRLFGHPGLERLEGEIEAALAAVNHALLEAAARSGSSPACRGLIGDGVESAAVLWQLAVCPEARAALPALDEGALRRALHRSGSWKDSACVALLTLAEAAAAAGVGAGAEPAASGVLARAA